MFRQKAGLKGVWRAGAVLLAVIPLGISAPSAQTRPGESTGTVTAAATDEVGPRDPWDRFSVDVSVRRSRVDKNGKPARQSPSDVTYRWVREQAGDGWKTIVTTLARSTPIVQGREGSYELDAFEGAPVRMEDDEDGTPTRFYNARGEAITRPTREALKGTPLADMPPPPDMGMGAIRPSPRRSKSREWAESFIVPIEKKDARRKSLEQRFGRAHGQVNGFEQFVKSDSLGREELLVDSEFNVPAEMNLVKDGDLVSHTTFSYARGFGNSLVRRGMRIEQSAAGPKGKKGDKDTDTQTTRKDDDKSTLEDLDSQRLVTEIEFSNLRLTKKGGAR